MTAPLNTLSTDLKKTEYWSRCIQCRLPSIWCICSFAPQHKTKTTITLLIHQTEWRKASNTGHMIRNAFTNQKILIQGRPHVQLTRDEIFWTNRPTYILYPGRGAATIDQIPKNDLEQGIHLIVPDGSWGQSSSMLKRIKPLHGTQTVMLGAVAPENRRQRINISPERMSTLEAIILAIHQLEGDSSERSAAMLSGLMRFYQMYADCMLMMRGKLKIGETTFGRLPV
jgi:DTW domain-containing protein YfiP